jgi:proteasome lid subunit RPN8/RPN11
MSSSPDTRQFWDARLASAAGRGGLAVGTLHRDACTICIQEQVLEQILDYSERDVTRERGGFLLGDASEESPPQVVIRHFLPALEVRAQGAKLTFTHETWAALNREAQLRFPDDRILGWQHTHPDLGVFLSAYDLFLHRHFFQEPWQLALVVDPVRHEFGFFEWRGNDIVDCGFICSPE